MGRSPGVRHVRFCAQPLVGTRAAGAQRVTVAGATMTFEFYNVASALKDRYVLPAN
jgi:hypothetical protein